MINAYYATRYSEDPGRGGVWSEIAKYLQRYVGRESAVLDLGAGFCPFINSIQAGKKFALDIHEEFKQYAASDVSPLVGSCCNLSKFTSASLDVVFASNLFEHLSADDLRQTLSEIWRVLRDGGRLILMQPNFRTGYREYFDDYTHVQIFSHISLPDLLRSKGWRIETVEPRFLPMTMKSRLPKWPWIVTLYLRLPWRPGAKQMLVVASKRESSSA